MTKLLGRFFFKSLYLLAMSILIFGCKTINPNPSTSLASKKSFCPSLDDVKQITKVQANIAPYARNSLITWHYIELAQHMRLLYRCKVPNLPRFYANFYHFATWGSSAAGSFLDPAFDPLIVAKLDLRSLGFNSIGNLLTAIKKQLAYGNWNIYDHIFDFGQKFIELIHTKKSNEIKIYNQFFLNYYGLTHLPDNETSIKQQIASLRTHIPSGIQLKVLINSLMYWAFRHYFEAFTHNDLANKILVGNTLLALAEQLIVQKNLEKIVNLAVLNQDELHFLVTLFVSFDFPKKHYTCGPVREFERISMSQLRKYSYQVKSGTQKDSFLAFYEKVGLLNNNKSTQLVDWSDYFQRMNAIFSLFVEYRNTPSLESSPAAGRCLSE